MLIKVANVEAPVSKSLTHSAIYNKRKKLKRTESVKRRIENGNEGIL